MKTSTFLKRTEDLLTKKGSLKVTYIRAIENIKRLANNTILSVHPLYWTKNKGRFHLEDTTYKNMIHILVSAKIDYIEGNDAPREGKEGIYIQLTSKGKQQLKDIDFSQLLSC